MESQYLKCDCDVSNSEINTENINKFNSKSIYQSFFSVLKYSNYKVLKCYKLVFSIKSITINIGSIITIVYFSIYILFLILYYIKGKNKLKEELSKYFEVKKKIIEKKYKKEKNIVDLIKLNKNEDNKNIIIS